MYFSYIFLLSFIDWDGNAITTVVDVASPTKHVANIKHSKGQSTITTEIVGGKKVQVT